MVSTLSSRIRHGLNLTMTEFCEKHLQTDYRTFQYRMRRGSFIPAEVVYICWILNDSCENLFGKSFADLVLLKRAPGDTGPYIIKRLNEATPEERSHLMGLIGGMSLSGINKDHHEVRTPPIPKPPVKTDPILHDEIKVQPAPKKFDSPIIEIDHSDEIPKFAPPKEKPPESSGGFQLIDIDLTGGVAGR